MGYISRLSGVPSLMIKTPDGIPGCVSGVSIMIHARY